MGRIATTAATHANFFEHGFPPFKNGDVAFRIGFRSRDGREKTRSSAAYDGYIHYFTTKIGPLDSR
jgi:hypothetical protein